MYRGVCLARARTVPPTRCAAGRRNEAAATPCLCRGGMMSSPLEKWVEETERVTTPDRVVWCDGSDRENERMVERMIADGTLLALNPKTHPNCYLPRRKRTHV